MAENPVIRRFGAATGAKNVPTPSAGDLQNMYDQPTRRPTAGRVPASAG